jgi:thioredoxin-like negative regulator of GroEL
MPDKQSSRMLQSLDQFDFHRRLDAPGSTALVVFSAPACGSCRHLRGVLAEVGRRRPEWRLFEVDVQRDQALANEFEVFHLPTLFVYSAAGFHCRLDSEARPDAIIAATERALAAPAEEAP